MDKDAETKIVKARISLLRSQPFFGTLALRLIMVQDDTLQPPTMAVDGTHIFYHPEFVNNSSHKDVEFIVAHEVMHCVFHHIARLGGRDLQLWNMAGDYVINSTLVEAGLTMPSSGLHDAAYSGKTTDEIYNILAQKPSKQKPQPFDSFKPPQQSPAEMKEMEEDWKIATVQAANAAKAAGKLPGSLKRFVDELVATKTDWRSRLRQFATDVTRNDYSWQRFNRRYLSLGYYLPGLYSERMGTMVIVTDDSGSIGNDILQLFASEIDAIRDAVQPERTIIISCDARVNYVDDLTMDDTFKLQCHGGGGTDFRPPFDWLEKEDIQPSCLIYLTDLEGPFPKHAPSYPVLWCATTNHKAPWGETLHINKD